MYLLLKQLHHLYLFLNHIEYIRRVFIFLECKCPCSAIGSAPIKSNDTEKLKQRIKELRSMLLIQKNMTAKARLLKICASDPRPSAKGIGVVLGIGVLVVIISSIVLLDLPNLINAVKSKKQ